MRERYFSIYMKERFGHSLGWMKQQAKSVIVSMKQHICSKSNKPLYIVRKAVAHVRDQPKKSTYCVQLMKNKEIEK